MPLFPRLVQTNTGRKPPERIEPVPERAVSTTDPQMHPYRGFEDHGVPTTNVPQPIMPETGHVLAHYTTPAHEPNPIPVRIVTEGGREFRTFSTYTEAVPAKAYPIVGRHVDRSKVTIRNHSAVRVWLGPDTVTPTNGYPLDPNQEVSWEVHAAIYAVTDDGSTQRVSIVQFFALPLDASRSVQPGT